MPFTRTDDPQTSHDAEASISDKSVRASQEAILSLFDEVGRITDTDLVEIYDAFIEERWGPKQSPSGLRTRRKELVEKGFLRDSEERTTLPSGRTAIVWELNESSRP